MAVRYIRPAYPASYKGTGHDETVTLAAVIGVDGTMRQVNAVGTPTPEFAAAATEAVRQWEFSPTLMNCEPQEVTMKVTGHFKVAPPPPGAR